MTSGTIDHQPDYVYVIYIAAPQEKVWEALITDAFTEQYIFGTRMRSDWRVGSPVTMLNPADEITNQGTILAYDPPRLLAMTWESEQDTNKRDQPSAVSFKLDTFGGTTRLTLTHTHLIAADLAPEADWPRGFNNGWPIILSNLKSLLEIGRVPTMLSDEVIDEARKGQ